MAVLLVVEVCDGKFPTIKLKQLTHPDELFTCIVHLEFAADVQFNPVGTVRPNTYPPTEGAFPFKFVEKVNDVPPRGSMAAVTTPDPSPAITVHDTLYYPPSTINIDVKIRYMITV